MGQLLSDDTAWGKNGWMKPREQIVLATTAQERACGKLKVFRWTIFTAGRLRSK